MIRLTVRHAGLVTGRWARGVAVVLVVAAVAVFAARGHRPLPAASFEFGVVRSFEGFVAADPYPSLIVPRGAVATRYLLVGPGKSGADELVREAVGRWTALDGSLAFRGGQALIEVVPGSLVPAGEPVGTPDAEGRPSRDADEAPSRDADGSPSRVVELGEHYLEGEIVGAKCHLGVMNPGSGIVHRECAALCLRGGVPPLLAVRRTDGVVEGIVVTGPAGRAVGRPLADLAGVPVGATGRLVRQGATTFFRVDPSQVRRLR